MSLVYGVGYMGHGTFRSCTNGKASRAHRRWEAMLQRCYSDRHLGISSVLYSQDGACKEKGTRTQA